MGDGYLNTYKTFNYRRYLEQIENEKEKERRYMDAQVQAEHFKKGLPQGVKEIKGKLSPEKKAPAALFGRYCSSKREKRYLGESFADILASDAERKNRWTQGYIRTAEAKVRQFIPEEPRGFVSMESAAVFFLLPRADYPYRGVPCLDIHFDIFSVVTAMVSVRAGSKEFSGIACRFSLGSHEDERLGFYQITVSSAI